MNRSHLAGRDITKLIAPARFGVSGVSYGSGFDTSYDLRTLGYVTDVRNQNPYGDCWAYATYGSMESNLKKAGETRDFNEYHMAANHGFDWDVHAGDGGNANIATAYLARWSGPVDENTTAPVQKHVQEMFFLPPATGLNDAVYRNNVKAAIQTYGALYAGIYWDDNASKDNYTYYYNTTCGAGGNAKSCRCTMADESSCGGHAITLVGWDDSVAASKFRSTPPGPGAFIAKNSWGTSDSSGNPIGAAGYFYISYYDSSIGGETAVFTVPESTTNYNTVYQYDPLGDTIEWGSEGPDRKVQWMSNIFTASAKSYIRAAGFYTTDITAAYELYIYTGVTAGAPRSGTLAYSATGSFPMAGYHTVVLPGNVMAAAGSRFSLVVKLTNPTYEFPVAIEVPFDDYSSAATASPGQSYYSDDGASWNDLIYYEPNGNVCLKAYAGVDNTPPTTVSVNDGLAADIARTGVKTSLSANWTAAVDAESGVTGYYYAIGTAPGDTGVLGWTSNGNATSVTKTGLTLAEGSTYYVGVKAVNAFGLYGSAAWSDGQLVDTASPEDIPYVYDGLYADLHYVSSVHALSARWGASSYQGGSIAGYWYAIGTSSGGTDTLGWTSNGTATSVTKTGLSLIEGNTYYVSVKARNDLNVYSAVRSSNGQVPDISSPTATVLLSGTQPLVNGAFSGKLIVNDYYDRLAAAPRLYYTGAGGWPAEAPLVYLTGSTWTFTGYVESYFSSGKSTFTFTAADLAGNTGTVINSGSVFTVNTSSVATAGAYFANSDTMAVTIPAGVYTGTLHVSIATVAASVTSLADATAAESYTLPALGLTREFSATDAGGSAVTTFPGLVRITMSYPDADNNGRIDGTVFNESTAYLYYLDLSQGKWTPLGINFARDTVNNTVSAWTTHFSVYSVRSAASATGALALKAYPNPCDFRKQQLVFSGIPPDAAGVKIYIYNAAGELVRALVSGETTWDGLNKSGAKAASGIYMYLVKTANYSSDTGKFYAVW